MEEGEIEQSPLQCATAPPMIVSTVKVTVHDDSESRMSYTVIDSLQLEMRCKRDLLEKEDMHKNAGDEKFNPKSFKSGSSVGYIDLDTVLYEVKFAQIRMLRELMFDIVHLGRYNHLVGDR